MADSPAQLPRQDAAPFLRARDVAALLGVSLPTVRAMVARGMPALRPTPRVLRFEREAVLAWVREQRAA